MTYELMMIKKIVYLVEEEILISRLTREQLVELTKVRIDRSFDITEIETSIKEIIDYLVLKYGMLETLKRLYKLRYDAITFKMNREEAKTSCDIGMFLLSLGYLYSQVEKYYTVNVFLKVYSLIPKISNGTLSKEKFLRLIIKDSIPSNKVLGLKEREYTQESIFEMPTKESVPLESVMTAMTLRNQVAMTVKSALEKSYSHQEICAYCSKMVDWLAMSSLEEYKIIKNILTSVVGSYLLRSKSEHHQEKIDGQMSIEGYHYQILPNMGKSTSKFIKV